MLTQETKRKIDTARDILVGKVPDPKAQVEQITTALIYKFMDDMDKEAQELGGKSRFFSKGYEKYSWTKLIDSRLSGQSRLNLYLEAIVSLSQNPNLPQLFRDIFKDAFLPYRDPETLNLFLKEINGFTYDHSEDLGDAFEYLLSILGSQGEAGQFRTPRHIIDFIVDAVDPSKNDTVCDPACGTAGFLISSYKHILQQHDMRNDPDHKEYPLTPDERKSLMDHFSGYDISPDMVRLSKVNMYLHGFPTPTIYEYDTLTSEEKWDESFDVMLANPPFMTPKGGIKPHKRFSVRANRSEVLFVDYILEHLRSNGRAGIIVPEGIIFQTAIAYRALRKLLIEDGLFIIVSLPAGVFNPYAGVKTSILLFDKELARKTKDLLFIKINNDGFDLGAQRREIGKNDLPTALEIVRKYKSSLLSRQPFVLNDNENSLVTLTAKETVAKDADCNLTGDRYRVVEKQMNRIWPSVELGKITKMVRGPFGGSLKKEIFKPDGYLVYEQHHAINADFTFGRYFIDKAKFEEMQRFEVFAGDILISCSGTMGKIAIVPEIYKKGIINQALLKLTPDKSKILPDYLKLVLESDTIQNKYFKNQSGVAIQNVASVKVLSNIDVPLPPIQVQEDLINQINSKKEVINSAISVIVNLEREGRLFGQSLGKLEGVEWLELGKIALVFNGITFPKNEYRNTGQTKIIKVKDYDEHELYFTKDENGWIQKNVETDKYLQMGDTLIINAAHSASHVGGKIGYCKQLPSFKCLPSGEIMIVRPIPGINPLLLNRILKSDLIRQEIKKSVKGIHLYPKDVKIIKVPLPLAKDSKLLVTEIEEQEKIIEVNKRLIATMEKKIENILQEI
jgi:type I restriction enzyme M protein